MSPPLLFSYKIYRSPAISVEVLHQWKVNPPLLSFSASAISEEVPPLRASSKTSSRSGAIESKFNIDSIGTIDYHEGNQADPWLKATSKRRWL
ncbi:hypothetical protein HHK36_011717 [Tetracentron sinense]|uniref:Uncharacterized protein n=1 Tax=Tetracentron sinense TaxID=13715 RepID=A0A834ZEB8_TETSI|nr:hypothetical protein HHK36_011717 [Tetracentron sinense]